MQHLRRRCICSTDSCIYSVRRPKKGSRACSNPPPPRLAGKREHAGSLRGGQGPTEPVLRREVERDEPEARIRMLRREADVKGDVEDAQVGRIYGANLQFRYPIVQARTRRFTGRGSRLRDQEGILPTAPRVRMPLSTCGRWHRSSWSQSGDPSLRRCPCPALCERAVRIPAGTL